MKMNMRLNRLEAASEQEDLQITILRFRTETPLHLQLLSVRAGLNLNGLAALLLKGLSMNALEKRIAGLEVDMCSRSTAYAILPEGFTGQLPPQVIGIRTGAPRYDDDPARFKIVGGKS